MTPPFSLKEHLERTRFERALECSESIASHHHVLNTMELGRLNNILCGKKEDDPNPWREGSVTLMLPSGNTETLSLIADPKVTAREALYAAAEVAERGDFIGAALTAYVRLVLAHSFEDANRRTAVLAAHYFLTKHGIPVSAERLHQAGAGDLRDSKEVDRLRAILEGSIKS